MTAFHVLIVEDEALVALMMQMLVEDEGWTAIGPVGTVAKAIETVNAGIEIGCALLDLNLRGETSWPVADALAAKGIPFAFTSGYGASGLETRFADRPIFPKPIDENAVRRFLTRMAGAPVQG
ncbi:MAG: response regulator [Alphaproteobacteria bacterium]|nr:response regulator [Alphaproteobacteria bacterium]